MPRARNPENKDLPKGWVIKHNAYYYNVPKGLEPAWNGKTQFRLGKELGEAYAEYGRRVMAHAVKAPETSPHLAIRNVAEALDHYLLLAGPKWREGTTLKNNRQSIKTLKIGLGHLKLKQVTVAAVYQYIRERAAFEQSKKEVAQLTLMLDYAVTWELIAKNPIRDQVNWAPFEYLKEAAKRDKFYVSDDEVLAAAVAYGRPWMWTYLALKLRTGLRGIDLRVMRVKQYVPPGVGEKSPGIWTHIGKDRDDREPRIRIYELDQALHHEMQQHIAGRDREAPMFVTGGGKAIDRSTMQSYWDAMMRAHVKAGGRKFSEQLIRVKVGSDAENIKRAVVLLGHRDKKVTKGFYRLGIEHVPLT